MISSLVSSILSGVASTAAAERAPARQAPDRGPGQAEEDASRTAATAAVAVGQAAGRTPGPAVDRGGPADRVDYFHAAKHMLGKAMAGFRRDLRDAVAGLGFDDGTGGKLTQAVMRETRDALLWGAGFSVKLMTATVSQTAAGAAPSFSVTARSIEIAVNHATGVVGVEAGDVSIRSHSSGAPGEAAPHLLDIEDSGDAASARLLAALQALQNPESLLEDEDDQGAGAAGDAPPAMHAEMVALPHIDTPAVLTRPGYSARIMITAMEQHHDERGDRITRLRLDAVIPLTERRSEHAATASVLNA